VDNRPGPSTRVRLRAFVEHRSVARRDSVATEEPLEIRVAAGPARRTIAVTMRTPGHDFELAAGFLAGEGVLASAEEVVRVDYCTDLDVPADQLYNVVTVTLRRPDLPDLGAIERTGLTSSACGVCGKANVDALALRHPPVSAASTVSVDVLYSLPEQLRTAQAVFGDTGGLHAAGLFTVEGRAVVVREDVGRHNAVDKVVGHRLLGAGPGAPVLMVSGRTSFEIVQKAVAARIPIVAGVSAPSSLAVAVAERFGVTLAGFVRGERANIYSHPDRIVT
jgi:FdhD protein